MSEPAYPFAAEGLGLPTIWPPALGLLWATVPALSAALLGSSDLGVTILYLWCWCIVIPATLLGIGAVVIRYRYGDTAGGRWRRQFWYWIGGLYAAAAIPVLALLL